MARITSILVVVLAITATSSAALAVDCLSYLAADTALKKANNDAHAAYRKAVQAAETVWEEAVQNREVAWREAGKAAYRIFSQVESGRKLGLEIAESTLLEAKAEADASRESAVRDAYSALTATVDKARTEVLGQDRTIAYRKASDAYRKAYLGAASGDPKLFDTLKEFITARVTLGDALAEVPPEARTPYIATWNDAEVKHMQDLIAAAQVRSQRYSEATAEYEKEKGAVDAAVATVLEDRYLEAGKAAFSVYWETIHDAYFAYRNAVEPAEADRRVAEAKAKDKWRETYNNIYKNPNIGLIRNLSGESEDEVFQKAEAERQICPY